VVGTSLPRLRSQHGARGRPISDQFVRRASLPEIGIEEVGWLSNPAGRRAESRPRPREPPPPVAAMLLVSRAQHSTPTPSLHLAVKIGTGLSNFSSRLKNRCAWRAAKAKAPP
jgi:hypothetical protein